MSSVGLGSAAAFGVGLACGCDWGELATRLGTFCGGVSESPPFLPRPLRNERRVLARRCFGAAAPMGLSRRMTISFTGPTAVDWSVLVLFFFSALFLLAHVVACFCSSPPTGDCVAASGGT